jgi:hydroxymethylbilane synthase
VTAKIRIGTRGSPLSLAQARELVRRLAAADPALGEAGAVEIVPIRTTGDRLRTPSLAEVGGKGLFVKELDEALRDGRVDLAVHSMKDVPVERPDGLVLAALLPREDPRDALVANGAASIAALEPGAVVGTSSPRRRAMLLHLRGDLRIVPFRGNVDTRLKKLAAGEVDATLLALAGLKRIGRADAATAVLSPEEFLPAACQGAIGIECRAADGAVRAALARVNDADTACRIAAERALLAALGGSCVTPVAALAELDGERLSLRGQILMPDGTNLVETRLEGERADAAELGATAGAALKRRAPPGFFG